MLEKDRELSEDKSRGRFQGEKSSRFASDLTNSGGGGSNDDYKRAKKIKRDHRRTRVIRTTPLAEEEESQANLNSFSSIAEQSPAQLSDYTESSCATPGDDRVRDPDWGQTPLRTKSNKMQKTILKRKTSNGNLRKTRSNSRLLSTTEIASNNDENKV